jgi:phosphatidate cytidylyltransferase
MFKHRVITSLVLLAILLPALFYASPVPFVGVTLLLIGVAGWEWARLNGCRQWVARAAGFGLGLGLASVWWWVGPDVDSRLIWLLASLIWLLATPWLLYRGVAGWPAIPRVLRLTIGWLLLAAAWWALVQAWVMGVGMLLSILLLVWVADIAAYFGGKAFGRHKLAPRISPSKTWEGAISGWVGVTVLFFVWVWGLSAWSERQLFGVLWAWSQPLLAMAALWLLVAMSVAGDLVESLVKRSAGRKDSSSLMPGHGGVLDRIDALLPVLPLAMWMVSW